jgi:outer membrane receptor protein involved in Fe transport
MKNTTFKISAITAALLSTCTISSAFADDEQQLKSIEKITVLGEKTERSLKDTASSVSVISEEVLKTMQHISINEAVSEIPNVVVLRGAVPDIRGVSGNGSATGFNGVSGGARARVTTLIDGVAEPFMADLTGDTGIWDIEQIEVFRGPQSTINGRNSMGGMIYIKTKDPSYDWEGAARLGYRDQDRYVDTSFMLSGPIVDEQLAFRLTAQNLDGEAYDNSVIFDDNPPKYNLDELKTTRVKAKLLWEPKAIDSLSALFTYSSNEEKGNTGRTYFTADEPWKFVPMNQRYMDTSSDTASVRLDYKISDDLAFDILIASMDYEWGFDSYDETPTAEQTLLMNEDNLTIDSKIRFGMTSKDLFGFVGLSYFERDQDYQSISTRFPYSGDDESESIAIYGEVNIGLNQDFTLIVGGRVEKESQYRTYEGSILDNDKTITLPKVVLQYAVSDSTTATVSARKGYNAGGGAYDWSSGEYYYYDSEEVITYETGIRSSFSGGDINVSANLFYNNYSDYQGTDLDRHISNIETVTTYGLEVELSAMLSQNLRLNIGLGLMESEIEDNSEGFSHIDGNELSSAPGYTANLGLTYWLTDALTTSFSYNMVDEYFGEVSNTKERVAGDYQVARVSVNYEMEQWQFNLFVNNAFDEEGITAFEPIGRRYPQGYAGIVDPRTFGGSVTFSF